MPSGCDLAALRGAVVLFEGEVALDGWAVERRTEGRALAGLLLVTSQRAVFIDVAGACASLPMDMITSIEICGTAQVRLSTCRDHMYLDFDNLAAANAAANLLRQGPSWGVANGALRETGRKRR